MEGLTKQQLVLVALLVSFVTSIATGIVTVALMDQAPPEVNRTINRVVERTIERVVQAPAQTSAAVVTKETVVLKEDDLVIDAIAKNTPSVVRITRVGFESGVPETVALGFVATKDGLIVTDASVYIAGVAYSALFASNQSVPLTQVFSDEQHGLVIFKLKPVENTKVPLTPISLGNSDALKLGQALVLIGGAADTRVETGIISGFVEEQNTAGDKKSAETKGNVYAEILTNMNVTSNISGQLLVTLSSEAVGFRVYRAGRFYFVGSNTLSQSLAAYATTVSLVQNP